MAHHRTVDPSATKPDAEFKPQLTLLDAVMLVVGAMIGSGIFIVSADIARTMGSPGGLLVVWAATGILTLFGALAYGEGTGELALAKTGIVAASVVAAVGGGLVLWRAPADSEHLVQNRGS